MYQYDKRPLAVFLLINLIPCLDLKVLAEQQAGKKAVATENERDRSPIRGNRTPLLPDPVPGSFAQAKSKRRALLPTPPGTQDETTAATNTTEGADPVARYAHFTHRISQVGLESSKIHSLCSSPGLIRSTTSKCISINSISNTSNSTSTSSMPTAIPLRHRLHPPPHRPRPPSLHHRARTRCRRPTPTQTRTPRGRTTPRPAATPHLPGATTPQREAMTRRGPMRRQRAHTIRRERTQRPEATPPPHRMSRQPHTGNPRPSAMITLTTLQSPLIDRCPPNTHSSPPLPLCPPKQSLSTLRIAVCVRVLVCLYMHLHEGQFKLAIRFECASKKTSGASFLFSVSTVSY